MLQPSFCLPGPPCTRTHTHSPSWRPDSKGSLSFVSRAASLSKGAFIFVSRTSTASAETPGWGRNGPFLQWEPSRSPDSGPRSVCPGVVVSEVSLLV